MRRYMLANTSSLTFNVWDGTIGSFPQLDEDGWYVINNCGELAAVAKAVNSGGVTTGSSVKFRLASNLDLNNINWTPIGSSSRSFTNIFDGAGHTIKNLKADSSDFAGLFGYAINMEDIGAVRISGIILHGVVGGNSNFSGGICAYSGIYDIENCVNYCTVSGRIHAGGIVGRIASSPMVPIGYTRILNCINFGNIVGIGTNAVKNIGGICGGVNQVDQGLNIIIQYCTNYGDISSATDTPSGILGCSYDYYGASSSIDCCSNAGSVRRPIATNFVSSSDCYYWNDASLGVGTKVSGPRESIVTSMELNNDLFLPTTNEKIKVKIYPPESYTKPNNPTVGIEITHSDNSKTTTQIPYDVKASFDASDLWVGSVGKIKYLNYFPAGADFPIEANLYYRRYINLPPKPDDSFDVWDGQIVSDPFTGGPDADGWYIIDSAAKMGAFTAKTNYQAYPGWTAFPETYVKVKVTKNIDMNNHPVYCIGIRNYSGGNGFIGHFDGQGHTIRNINMTSGEGREAGFFSFSQKEKSSAGTPSIIENFQITGTVTPYQLANYLGGVIGLATNTKIQNIVSNISMVQDGNWGSLIHVGGIAGAIEDSLGNTMVQNCVVLNNINARYTYMPMNIGGIVGSFGGNNIIQNCTFNGDEINVLGIEHYVGGICGKVTNNGGVIRYCSAYAIQPQEASSQGGICGYTDQPQLVTQCCYSDGNANGMGGIMVSNVSTFPVTSCILRQYEYPAEAYWMKGTTYPKNIIHASDDIEVRIYDRQNAILKAVALPIQKQASYPEYALIDFDSRGGRGTAGSRQSSGGSDGVTNTVPLAIEFKIGKGLYKDNVAPWKEDNSSRYGRYLLDNTDAKYYTITKSGFTVNVSKIMGQVQIGLDLSDTQEGGSYSITIPLPEFIEWSNNFPTLLSFYVQSASDSQYAHQVYCNYTKADGSTGSGQSVAVSPGNGASLPNLVMYDDANNGTITISGSSGKQNLSLTISTMFLTQDRGGGSN